MHKHRAIRSITAMNPLPCYQFLLWFHFCCWVKIYWPKKSNLGGKWFILAQNRDYSPSQGNGGLKKKERKSMVYWHKNKCVDQWNRIQDPDTNACIYNHVYFYKDARARNTCWRKVSLSNKCTENTRYPCREENNESPISAPWQKLSTNAWKTLM